MRWIIKILLFPVTLALPILIGICRLLCSISTVILCLLAFTLLAFGIATMVLLQDTAEGWRFLAIAWAISPIGLPLIATFLIELLGVCNDWLKGTF